MKDAYALDQIRNEKFLARKKASAPRGIKERQTLTSLMRVEQGKMIRDEFNKFSAPQNTQLARTVGIRSNQIFAKRLPSGTLTATS